MHSESSPGRCSRASVWVLGAALIAVPLVLIPGLYHYAALPKLVLVQVAAAGLLAVLSLTAQVRGVSFSLLLPLLLVVGVTVLQFGRSLNPAAAVLPLVMLTSCAAIAIGTASLLDRERLRTVMVCAAVGGALVSVAGLAEVWGALNLLPTSGRPGSTLGFRNAAASYLVINLPFTGLLLFERRRGYVWTAGLSMTLMAAFLLQTRSRGAWVGLALSVIVGLSLVIATRKRTGKFEVPGWPSTRLVVGCLAGVVALGMVPALMDDDTTGRLDERKAGIASTINSVISSGGDRGRVDVWKGTLSMISDSPVLGVGLGNWGAVYPVYDSGRILKLASDPRRPHNDFLWIWAESGTVGLLFYLWLIGAASVLTFRQVVRGDPRSRAVALSVGMGMTAYLGHSFFSFPREWAAPTLLFWSGFGILSAQENRPSVHRPLPITLGALVLCVAGLVVCYRAIRFDRLLYEAAVAQDAGQWQKQTRASTEAIGFGVFDHRALLLEGDGRMRTGQARAATQSYERLRQFLPNNPASHNNLGQAYAAAGATEQAIGSFQTALSILPGDPIVMNNLALAYEKQGKTDLATELIRKIEKASRSSGQAYVNLGLIHARHQDLGLAEEAYEKALELSPSLEIARYNLAGIWMLKGEFSRAGTGYEEFLNRWEGDEAYARRSRQRLGEIYPLVGDSLLAAGEMDRALRLFERLDELGMAEASSYNNLAILRSRFGDRVGAVEAARKGVQQDSVFARTYFTLGGLLEEAGDKPGAIAAYGRFLERWDGQASVAEEARSRLKRLTATGG